MNASGTSGTPAQAVTLGGWLAGRSLHGIAVELYGREEVEARWHDDGPVRSRLRRLLSRARARAGAGPEVEREADPDPDLR